MRVRVRLRMHSQPSPFLLLHGLDVVQEFAQVLQRGPRFLKIFILNPLLGGGILVEQLIFLVQVPFLVRVHLHILVETQVRLLAHFKFHHHLVIRCFDAHFVPSLLWRNDRVDEWLAILADFFLFQCTQLFSLLLCSHELFSLLFALLLSAFDFIRVRVLALHFAIVIVVNTIVIIHLWSQMLEVEEGGIRNGFLARLRRERVQSCLQIAG
mmetsp:Transcript_9112/g.26049  ORF Transcript_9112/g.26049 Transcript_9112/m.26049 type:complete len:211 (-) Transcript_9112:298-930(-)